MGAKSSRQYTYQQYYEAMKKSGNTANIDLKNINMESFFVSDIVKNIGSDVFDKIVINTCKFLNYFRFMQINN